MESVICYHALKRDMSLKQRLLLLVLSVVCLIWLAAAAFTYWDAKHELNQVLDAHLAQASTLLVAQSSKELDDLEKAQAPCYTNIHGELLFKFGSRISTSFFDPRMRLAHHWQAHRPALAI